MSSGRAKTAEPFLMLKYQKFSFIINGAFIKETMIDSERIGLPNLRYPFDSITVRKDRVFPVLNLDEKLSINDRGFFPFFLFIETAKCRCCINSSRLPVIFHDFFMLEKIKSLVCFDIYKKGDELFFDIIPDELYRASENNFKRLSDEADGGTGI